MNQTQPGCGRLSQYYRDNLCGVAVARQIAECIVELNPWIMEPDAGVSLDILAPVLAVGETVRNGLYPKVLIRFALTVSYTRPLRLYLDDFNMITLSVPFDGGLPCTIDWIRKEKK